MSVNKGTATRQKQVAETSNKTVSDKKSISPLPRINREIEIVNSLSTKERKAVELTLKILEEKKSRWLTSLMKYASSVSSEEIAKEFDGIERSFEVRGKAASEIWKDKKTRKKKYKSVDKLLPDFFKSWLNNWSERRKNLKKVA